jgi:hypothetical protein
MEPVWVVHSSYRESVNPARRRMMEFKVLPRIRIHFDGLNCFLILVYRFRGCAAYQQHRDRNMDSISEQECRVTGFCKGLGGVPGERGTGRG